MYYKNILTRFIFRKNFFKRIKMRISIEKRKFLKNEFDDLSFLYFLLDRKPKHIIDGGANIGFVSYQFLKRFKTAKIYAFEPNPSVFELLKNSFSNKVNSILTYNLGISNTSGKLSFYKNNNSGTSSFLPPNDFHKSHLARKFSIIDVPVITLHDFCKENNIDLISILKLDIEGYELKALQGCEEMIKNQKIEFIYVEVNLVPTYVDQCLIEEVIGYLRKFNYIPYNFYGSNETELRESIITNILFMSKSIADEIVDKKGINSIYTN